MMPQMMPRGFFARQTAAMRTGDFLNEDSNFRRFSELSLCIYIVHAGSACEPLHGAGIRRNPAFTPVCVWNGA
jgi:hypothetical protein